jgi:hypothetical protein
MNNKLLGVFLKWHLTDGGMQSWGKRSAELSAVKKLASESRTCLTD